MTRLIIWGAGELGGRVGIRWGGEAIGLTKTAEKHDTLRRMGIMPGIGSAVPHLRPDDLLLLALPGHANQKTAVDELRTADVPVPQRAILISSTGYYGGTTGLIDEETPPGDSERAQAIAALENSFLVWAGEAGIVMRYAGLYRPGRGPFAAFARRKTVSDRPPDQILGLIHYDDAATAVSFALIHPQPEQVYLGLVTPSPTRQQFYTAACRKLGLDEPAFETPPTTPTRRYDNGRFQRDLLPQPAHPDWHAALE